MPRFASSVGIRAGLSHHYETLNGDSLLVRQLAFTQSLEADLRIIGMNLTSLPDSSTVAMGQADFHGEGFANRIKSASLTLRQRKAKKDSNRMCSTNGRAHFLS